MEYTENYQKALEAINVNHKVYGSQLKKKNCIIKLCYYKQNIIHNNTIPNLEIKVKEEYEKKLIDKKTKLIQQILQKRQKANIKLVSAFRTFYNRTAFNKANLILKILQERERKAIFIQSVVRRFLAHKEINKLCLNKGRYIFFYLPPKMYISQSGCKDIPKISIQLKNGKQLDFLYSKLLHTYYIPLKKTGKRQYYLNFLINNNNIIDSRFPVELNPKTGKFYNFITSSLMYKARTSKPSKAQSKKWEQIFQIKNYYKKRKISFDTSVSQNTDVSAEINSIINNNTSSILINQKKASKPRQSILKPTPTNVNTLSIKSKKRVTFNTRCEYVIY